MRALLFIAKGIVGGPLALLFGAVSLMAMPLVLILLAGNALFDGAMFGKSEEFDR
jgi:hypothetical protein